MNKHWRTFYLTLLTVGGLVALGFLPEIVVGDFKLRGVDLFSDLRRTPPTEPRPEPKAVEAKADTTQAHTYQYFTDFTSDSASTLQAVVARLRAKKPVRIAYYGDSFIEGDIFTADLRDLLQERFGGGGVGMYDVSSNVENARGTLLQRSEGFRSYASNGRGYDAAHSSINLHYSIPESRVAQVTFTKTEYTRAFRRHNSDIHAATLYFATEGPARITALVGDSTVYTAEFQGATGIQTASVETGWGKTFTWRVETGGEGKTWMYSAAFDGKGGVTLDNISLRGSSGSPIKDINEAHMTEMARLRPYDLIFVGFGLNYASPERARSGYRAYKGDMRAVINKLRRHYPKATLVLAAMSDHAERDATGQIRTMPCVRQLVEVQREIARTNHVVFLNLFEAMGGENSIVSWVDEGRARKDYTHITYDGGRQLAETVIQDMLK